MMAIIEIARYKLREGADEQALIRAEKQIQQGVARQYLGNLGRELSRNENGEFVLIMRWESQAAADGWNTAMFQDPAGRALGGLVDPSSMRKETLNQLAP